MGELEGKVALVTGATRGLGRHLAERLGHKGCDLVLCARRQAALDEAKQEIVAATGARVPAQAADVSDESQVIAVPVTSPDKRSMSPAARSSGSPPPASHT